MLGVLEIELQSAERMYQVKEANLNQVRLMSKIFLFSWLMSRPTHLDYLIAPHGTGKDFLRDVNCQH